MSTTDKKPKNTSVWLAFRSRVFAALWAASVVSGVCSSAHDTAATWLMNRLGASPLLLSLMATAASLPFFLFTLPAGAVADLSDRRKLFMTVYLSQMRSDVGEPSRLLGSKGCKARTLRLLRA